MSSTKELTGGTGDVNPQLLHVRVTQQTTDLNTILQIPIPLQRISSRGTRSLVFELLQISFDFGTLTPDADSTIFAVVSTDPQALENSGRVLGSQRYYNMFHGSPTTGVLNTWGIKTTNLNDGAGHGVLVAVDNLFMRVDSANTGGINVVDFRLLYRQKEVSLQEYIGIVQSQQSG